MNSNDTTGAEQHPVPDELHAPSGDFVGADLLVGDCRVEMRKLPPESVDLAVPDPPYNLGLRYHDGYDDKQSPATYLEMLEESLAGIARLLKQTGSVFLFSGQEYFAETRIMLKEVGFHVRNTIAWYNTFGQAQQRKFTPSWTAIHYATKHPTDFTFNADAVRVPSARQLIYRDKRANPKGKLPDDVWVLLPEMQAPECFDPRSDLWLQSRVCGTFRERVEHVTQLPLALVERIIRVASNPGDTVFDPFAGTGTALLAALRLGRRALGIELSAETAALARARLAKELPQHVDTGSVPHQVMPEGVKS